MYRPGGRLALSCDVISGLESSLAAFLLRICRSSVEDRESYFAKDRAVHFNILTRK